jgi:hypothetical protein
MHSPQYDLGAAESSPTFAFLLCLILSCTSAFAALPPNPTFAGADGPLKARGNQGRNAEE